MARKKRDRMDRKGGKIIESTAEISEVLVPSEESAELPPALVEGLRHRTDAFLSEEVDEAATAEITEVPVSPERIGRLITDDEGEKSWFDEGDKLADLNPEGLDADIDPSTKNTLGDLSRKLVRLGVPVALILALFSFWFFSQDKRDQISEDSTVPTLIAMDDEGSLELDNSTSEQSILALANNDGRIEFTDTQVGRLLSSFGFSIDQLGQDVIETNEAVSEAIASPYIEINDADISTALRVANEHSLVDVVNNPSDFTNLRSDIDLQPGMPLLVNTFHEGRRGNLLVRSTDSTELGALRKFDRVFLSGANDNVIFSVNGIPTRYYGVTVGQNDGIVIGYVAAPFLMQDSSYQQQVATIDSSLEPTVIVVNESNDETSPTDTLPGSEPTTPSDQRENEAPQIEVRQEDVEIVANEYRRSLEEMWIELNRLKLSISEINSPTETDSQLSSFNLNLQDAQWQWYFTTQLMPQVDSAIHLTDLAVSRRANVQDLEDLERSLRTLRSELRNIRVAAINQDAREAVGIVEERIVTYLQNFARVENVDALVSPEISSNAASPQVDSLETQPVDNSDERLASMQTPEFVDELLANPEAYLGERVTYVSQRSGVAREYEFAGLNKNGHIQLAQVGNPGFRFAVKAENIRYLALSTEPVQQQLDLGVADISNITGERVDYTLAS